MVSDSPTVGFISDPHEEKKEGMVLAQFDRVLAAWDVHFLPFPFIRGKALRYLEEGKVVIFGVGTGNPFFTTDTAAALRGVEMGAEVVIKATKVDGVYTADPKKDKTATRYQKLSFDEAIAKNLKVMDATALTLCRDQKLPISVFSIFKAGGAEAAGAGRGRGNAGARLTH